MQRIFCLLVFLISFLCSTGQGSGIARPKLVVGIMVDQMRWDYLYRYYDRYDANGGFKRMLNQGFSCENTLIPYAPTVTACGHTTAYTGTVPAIHGISGNVWWDKNQMRSVYCTEDGRVSGVGTTSGAGRMSPRNMLVTTICDELRLATNFRSKVIGVAIKDRGGILPAGHSANAAYWFDGSTGDWVTSTYYMASLPKWVSDFNAQKLTDKYYEKNWELLYPANTYVQSSTDEKPYEGKPFGPRLPYDLKPLIGKSFSSLAATPHGNTMTVEFSKAAVNAEQLGADDITDFLAVSFSSPDYIGHTFGPNSIEAEDGFLKLDRELGNLFDFLDNKVGKNQYVVFLSADHGVSQVPEFLRENRLPAGRVFVGTLTNNLNNAIRANFGIDTAIVSDDNYQLHLNQAKIDAAKVNKSSLVNWIVDRVSLDSGVFRAFAVNDLNTVPLPAKPREMLNNGYFPSRNGDIQILLRPHYIDAYSSNGTTHGLWNPYDAHIPLLFWGWGIKQGKTNRETYMTDIAPTLAALLHIQMPSGNIGQVIQEAMK